MVLLKTTNQKSEGHTDTTETDKMLMGIEPTRPMKGKIKLVLLAVAQHRRLHSAFGWGDQFGPPSI